MRASTKPAASAKPTTSTKTAASAKPAAKKSTVAAAPTATTAATAAPGPTAATAATATTAAPAVKQVAADSPAKEVATVSPAKPIVTEPVKEPVKEPEPSAQPVQSTSLSTSSSSSSPSPARNGDVRALAASFDGVNGTDGKPALKTAATITPITPDEDEDEPTVADTDPAVATTDAALRVRDRASELDGRVRADLEAGTDANPKLAAPAPESLDAPAETEVPFAWTHSAATSVALVGSFNGWTDPVPMASSSSGHHVTLSLPPGTHLYKFVVDGTNWWYDVTAPTQRDSGGNVNNVVVV